MLTYLIGHEKIEEGCVSPCTSQGRILHSTSLLTYQNSWYTELFNEDNLSLYIQNWIVFHEAIRNLYKKCYGRRHGICLLKTTVCLLWATETGVLCGIDCEYISLFTSEAEYFIVFVINFVVYTGQQLRTPSLMFVITKLWQVANIG